MCITETFQSVVGLLQHACKVVVLGRVFMRRLHTLLSVQAQCIRRPEQIYRGGRPLHASGMARKESAVCGR